MTRLLGDTVIARCRSCGGWMMRAQGCGLCKDRKAETLILTANTPPLRKETP
jgi:hypothetical protein